MRKESRNGTNEPTNNRMDGREERDETRRRQRVERTRSPLLHDYHHFEIYNWKCNHAAKPRRHFDSPSRVLRGGNWQCSAIFIFPHFFLPSFSSFCLRSHYIVRSVAREQTSSFNLRVPNLLSKVAFIFGASNVIRLK